MRSRQVVLVAVLATAVAACGTSHPEVSPHTGLSSGARPVSTTATVPSHQPGVQEGPVGTLDVVVQEPAGRADSAVRFLRVEDGNGKALVERSYRTVPAELSDYLPAGNYRIVSWIRECGGPCGSKRDEDLGVPIRVCGIRVELAENAVAGVTVDAPADGDCTMAIAP